jgi:hypothetical protein
MTRIHRPILCSLLLLAFVAEACQRGKTTPLELNSHETLEDPTGPVWFEDVTVEMGLDFTHDPGPTGTFFMPQSIGSGCAFFRDLDGTLYIYLLNGAGPNSKSVNRLYRQAGGKFQDISADSGLDVAGYSQGVAVGDVNNDGRPDVLIAQYGATRLFLNLGNGKFQEITQQAGINNSLWGVSAAFVDFNRDGLLDLLVVNYVDHDPKTECFAPQGEKDFCGPNKFKGTASKLYLNLGPAPAENGKSTGPVRFQDVSFSSNIGRVLGPGLGVICADFDGDGWPDIFIANDGQPNRLWINQHNETFVDEAVLRGVAYNSMGKAYAGMGVAIGDVDNDLLFDIYVSHLNTETNTLWKQGPRGTFQDRSVEHGLTTTRWHGTGFGTLMADFNLDGALDIAVVNGNVYRGKAPAGTGLGFWEIYAERNQLFANDGAGKFIDISPSNKAFCGNWNVARGLAICDFDGDGAPDLLLTTTGNKARLFRNVAPDRGHWLHVRAIDPRWQRDAYGAEVVVRADGIDRLRLITAAQSFASSSDPCAFFGLGKSNKFESIRVKWPDGDLEIFAGGQANRALVLRKGEGRKP